MKIKEATRTNTNRTTLSRTHTSYRAALIPQNCYCFCAEEEEEEVYLCNTQHTIYKELQSNAKLQTV